MCRTVIGCVAAAVAVAVLAVELLAVRHLLAGIDAEIGNACEMTYMHPNYLDVTPQVVPVRPAVPYRVMQYAEGAGAVPRMRAGAGAIPVVFVPGNAGSYRQVRSIAAEAARFERGSERVEDPELAGGFKTAALALRHGAMLNVSAVRAARSRGYDFFALDFREELSGVSSFLLDRQTRFAAAAVAALSTRYGGAPVVVVGHSMGGVIALRLKLMSEEPGDASMALPPLPLVVTLNAPLLAPPATLDYQMVVGYQAHRTPRTGALLNIAGGIRDTLIRSELAFLPESPASVSVFSESIPGVGVSADHQAIVWCNQVVKSVVYALFLSEQPDVLARAVHRGLLRGDGAAFFATALAPAPADDGERRRAASVQPVNSQTFRFSAAESATAADRVAFEYAGAGSISGIWVLLHLATAGGVEHLPHDAAVRIRYVGCEQGDELAELFWLRNHQVLVHKVLSPAQQLCPRIQVVVDGISAFVFYTQTESPQQLQLQHAIRVGAADLLAARLIPVANDGATTALVAPTATVSQFLPREQWFSVLDVSPISKLVFYRLVLRLAAAPQPCKVKVKSVMLERSLYELHMADRVLEAANNFTASVLLHFHANLDPRRLWAPDSHSLKVLLVALRSGASGDACGPAQLEVAVEVDLGFTASQFVRQYHPAVVSALFALVLLLYAAKLAAPSRKASAFALEHLAAAVAGLSVLSVALPTAWLEPDSTTPGHLHHMSPYASAVVMPLCIALAGALLLLVLAPALVLLGAVLGLLRRIVARVLTVPWLRTAAIAAAVLVCGLAIAISQPVAMVLVVVHTLATTESVRHDLAFVLYECMHLLLAAPHLVVLVKDRPFVPALAELASAPNAVDAFWRLVGACDNSETMTWLAVALVVFHGLDRKKPHKRTETRFAIAALLLAAAYAALCLWPSLHMLPRVLIFLDSLLCVLQQ